MELALQQAIDSQRALLAEKLDILMSSAAEGVAGIWTHSPSLDQALHDIIQAIPECKMIYAVDCNGMQVSSSISPEKVNQASMGQDLSSRPYIKSMTQDREFHLSDVYLDRNSHQPRITAMQRVTRRDGEIMGCLAADFGLLDIPDVSPMSRCAVEWRQIKGDPAIRRNLFQQERVLSAMDENIDAVHDIVVDMLVNRGIFHAKLHYSSSRATLWLTRSKRSR